MNPLCRVHSWNTVREQESRETDLDWLIRALDDPLSRTQLAFRTTQPNLARSPNIDFMLVTSSYGHRQLGRGADYLRSR